MNIAVLKYPPRLARLYSEDVKRLEALHAGRLSPGATTWAEAVEALYRRMSAAGPRKGARLIEKAADYLYSIDRDARAHLVLCASSSSRRAALMFATFAIGNHPDPAVQEEGVVIAMHAIICARSRSSWASGVPVAFVSRHALQRLYEHGCDVEASSATSLLGWIAVAGFLIQRSEKHRDGGLYLSFADVMVAGGVHRFVKTGRNGRQFEESFFDVRTMLPAGEIGPARAHQLEQGAIVADVVTEWLGDASEEAPAALAEKIPFLPRREDHYPLRAAAMKTEPAVSGIAKGITL